MFIELKRYALLALISVGMIAGCASSPSSPVAPPRDFTTAELMIDKDTLPSGIHLGTPKKVRPDDFGGHEGGVSATAVDYNGAASGFHVVIQFQSNREAVQAYQEHAFTTDDTRGKYGDLPPVLWRGS